MPRQTPEQLRSEIIDRAAALFARQGLSNTALQQIADAVQYSKAGVLHYFPSKDAIYQAVIATACEQMTQLASLVERAQTELERDSTLVEAAIDMTYEWPGVAALSISLSEHDDLTDPRLLEASELLGAAWGIDENITDGRAVRVVVASAGLTSAAITAVRVDLKREWKASIRAAAMNALGHPA